MSLNTGGKNANGSSAPDKNEMIVVFKELKQRIQDLIEKKLSSYMSSKADDEINRMINGLINNLNLKIKESRQIRKNL